MSYVAKISLPNVDVKFATPEQCAVTSEYPPLKAKIGQSPDHIALLTVNFSSRVTQGTTHTIYSIPHDYGYVPLTLSNIIFSTNGGPGVQQDIVGIGYAGVGANLTIQAYADSTNYKVTIYDNFNWTNSSAILQVSYYIFAENGT